MSGSLRNRSADPPALLIVSDLNELLEKAQDLHASNNHTECLQVCDELEQYFLFNAAQICRIKSQCYLDQAANYQAMQSLIKAHTVFPTIGLQLDVLSLLTEVSPGTISPEHIKVAQAVLDFSKSQLSPAAFRAIAKFLRELGCCARSVWYESCAAAAELGKKVPEYDSFYPCAEAAKDPHIILATLPYSGSSAIDPILKDLLVYRHYDLFGTNYQSAMYAPFVDGPAPLYIWTHMPKSKFEGMLDSRATRSTKVLVMYRDPRDTIVSRMKDLHYVNWLKHLSEKELMIRLIQEDLPTFCKDTNEWLALPESIKFSFTFEEMKNDMTSLMIRILKFLEFDFPKEHVKAVIEAYSFEKITQRQRGEEGEPVRNNYVLRKGVSGEWRNYFDDEVKSIFKEKCNSYLVEWGYEKDDNW